MKLLYLKQLNLTLYVSPFAPSLNMCVHSHQAQGLVCQGKSLRTPRGQPSHVSKGTQVFLGANGQLNQHILIQCAACAKTELSTRDSLLNPLTTDAFL